MKRSKQTTNHSRRVFLARAISLAGLAGLAAIPGAASAQETFSPVAGRDYILIDPPQPTRVGAGKIEVLEFFNYSCPHCFRFQGPFARWRDRAAAEVEIARQPVVFSRTRGLYARLYYALESIGRGEELGDKIYEAIHRERRLLNSEGRIVDFSGRKRNRKRRGGFQFFHGRRQSQALRAVGTHLQIRRQQHAASGRGGQISPELGIVAQLRSLVRNDRRAGRKRKARHLDDYSLSDSDSDSPRAPRPNLRQQAGNNKAAATILIASLGTNGNKPTATAFSNPIA